MIKIDDKEIRNPIEQIKKNMDDIEKLKDQIYEVYNYNGVIGSTEIPYVNRSSTNVPEDVNKGWLVDYTGKLFKITGGNTTTLLLDYYANIKGIQGNTGPQGPEGPQGNPGVGIVSIVKTSTSGLVDTYTITYTNGQQSTFTVTNGEKGDPGAPGPTYNAGDNIQINNYSKIISANENIIPKTNYGYDLGSSNKLYKNVYAGGLKNTYFNILTGGVNGHGTAILSTTNAQGTTEGSLRLDYNKIQINQKLVPSSNNTLDLGASYSKFDKIYVNTLSDGTNTIDVADIGSGSEYTAGDGIDITDDTISIDTDTVALKSDIPDVSDFVTTTALSTTLDDYELKADAFSGDYTDLTNKPTIPTVEANSASTPTATLNNINIDGTVYSIPQGGSGNSSSGIYLSSADLDTTVNYNKIILISTINLGSNTLAVDDIIIGANKYVGVVTTIGVNPNNQPVAAVKTLGNITDPDLSNYVTTTALTTTLQDYELKAEAFSGDYDDLTDKPTIPTKTSDLTNDSGFITGITSIDVTTALGYTPGTSNFSGDYDDLTDKPDLSNFVTSSDLQTELQNYVESSDLATVATSGEYSDLIGTPTLATVATTGDYDDLTNKPTIPAAQVQSDWSQSDGTQVDYIKNKPDLSIYAQSANLAPVATSGDYTDLVNRPSFATVAITGDYDDLINKPTIPTVPITSISVNNIAQTPVQGNVDLTMNFAERIDVNGSSYTATNGVITLPDYPTLPTLATVATSGDYDDLINKPTIPTVPITEIQVNSTTVSPSSGVVDITVPTNSDYVDLTSNQSISGAKKFTSAIYLQNLIKANSGTYGLELPNTGAYTANKVIATTDQIPTSSDYVDLTTAQTINGDKSFTGNTKLRHTYPLVDDSFDLGLRSRRWYGLYLSKGLNDGNNSNYYLTLPDMTSWTADKTIATTDDIHDTIGEVIFSTTPSTGSSPYVINLTKDITQYDKIEIYYNVNDNIQYKTSIVLDSLAVNDVFYLYYIHDNTTPRLYIKEDLFTVTSTTSITVSSSSQTRIGNNEATSIGYVTNQMRCRPYKIIGYKNNASPQIISQPMYEDGDKFVNTNYYNLAGYITSGSKEMTFMVNVPKDLSNITSVTVDKFSCLIRGVSGYVNGYNYVDYASTTGYTINTYISSPDTVTIQVIATSAISGATNNTVLQAAFGNTSGELSLTFNA